MWIPQKEHYLATLLHPNVKRFQNSAVGERETAIEFVQAEIFDRQRLRPTIVTSAPLISSPSTILSSTEPKRNVNRNLFSQCYDRIPTTASAQLLDDELKEYMESTMFIDDEMGEDILSFWNKHCERYPMLASIARAVLAISASSTEVERLFSAAKFTVSDRRSSLGTEKLNKLIFIQKNLALLQELKKETNTQLANVKRKPDDDNVRSPLSPKRTKEQVVDELNDSD